MRAALLGALWSAALGGCGGPLVVAEVPVPATLPLRTVPMLFVAAGPSESERRLADGLAQALQGRRRGVARLDRATLETLRARGELPPASAVVVVEVEEARELRTRLGDRPETVCGPAGCYTRSRPDSYEVPALRLRARVTVVDSVTGRVLQRVALESDQEGRGYARMRERAERELLARLLAMTDPRVETVRVRLAPVDAPGVAEALADLQSGRWHRGRRRLEAVVRGRTMRALPPRGRARVWYDLAVARRFDPVTFRRDPERHFEVAEEALRRALRLDPDPRYDRALAELIAHRERIRQLREQQLAAEHNFRLAEPRGPALAPRTPPGYEARP